LLFGAIQLRRDNERGTTVLGVSASSAIRVLNDYALYKSTHSLTHSPRRIGHPVHSSTGWLAKKRLPGSRSYCQLVR